MESKLYIVYVAICLFNIEELHAFTHLISLFILVQYQYDK